MSRSLWIILFGLITFLNGIKDGFINSVSKNLIMLTPQGADHSTVTVGSIRSYTSEDLHNIGNHVNQHVHLRKLPTQVLAKIRTLKINRKRIRIRDREKQKQKRIIQPSNLMFCPITENKSEILRSKQIKFGTVNTRSIKKKVNMVEEQMTVNNLDFLFITETWLKDDENDKIWLKATELANTPFQIHSLERTKGKGGGILLVSRCCNSTKLIKKASKPSFEGATWKIIFGNNQLTVTGCYHPPPGTRNPYPNSMFIDQLSDYMMDIISQHPNNILLGDFNIHVNDPEDIDAGLLLDTLSAMGLKQHINVATHNKGNILDLLFTEEIGYTRIERIINGDFISDHRIVMAQLIVNKPRLPKYEKVIRKIDDKAVADLKSDYSSVHHNYTLDPSQCADLFETNLMDLLNKIAPEKKVQCHQRPKQLWYTTELREQKRIVRNRESKWLKYRENHLWLAYKRERNRYNAMLTYHKSQQICQRVRDAKGNTKKLHRVINKVMGKRDENPLPTHSSEQALSEDFADFFLNKIITIRESFELNEEFLIKPLDTPHFRRFAKLTSDAIKKIVYSMNTTSCELDPIPTGVLKEILEVCIDDITALINVSLEQGVFCEQWKSAIVRPLLKKISLELILKNYRPVSNLPFLSKLLEKCALTQLLEYCDEHMLIPDYQSAYRTGHSCETCVVHLVDDILTNMEKQRITPVVLLDLSAAFDTVDHTILLNVLNHRFGICQSALNWFTTYLSPRDFRVSVGNSYSTKKQLNFSVPQGSAAGANLFSLYCSNLMDFLDKDILVHGFADDHSLRNSFKAGNKDMEVDSITSLERNIRKVKDWMSKMRLKLNSNKTEFIMFGHAVQLNKTFIRSIEADQDNIRISTEVRCLGMTLDSNLNFKSHCINQSRKAMLNYIHIRNIRQYLDRETCEILVNALIISHLDYGNAILFGTPSVTLGKLQRVQNLSAKLILRKHKYDSVTECLKELHWLPIRARIDFKVISIVHKCIYGVAPKYLTELIVFKPQNVRFTRQQLDNLLLIIPTVKAKTFRARGFSFAGPYLWNGLPYDIRNIANYESFKKHLKNHLFVKLYK